MPRPRLAALILAVTAAVPATAACGTTSVDSSKGDASTLFERRAEHVAQAWVEDGVLERWRTSVVAAGSLTVEPPWTPRPNLKAAFGNGWVRTATALPTTPGSGAVTWDDGRTIQVRALDAQSAYDAMVPERFGPCPTPEGSGTGCDWVTITAATTVTTTFVTATGPARGPAWAFTVEGLDEPLVRVAVEAVEAGDLLPQDLPPSPREGRRILLGGQDVIGHAGASLTVGLGSGACDTDVRGHVFETDDVVVVGGTALAPPSGHACEAVLRLQPVTVTLRRPLGDRPVVDAASGRPLLSRVSPSGPTPSG